MQKFPQKWSKSNQNWQFYNFYLVLISINFKIQCLPSDRAGGTAVFDLSNLHWRIYETGLEGLQSPIKDKRMKSSVGGLGDWAIWCHMQGRGYGGPVPPPKSLEYSYAIKMAKESLLVIFLAHFLELDRKTLNICMWPKFCKTFLACPPLEVLGCPHI